MRPVLLAVLLFAIGAAPAPAPVSVTTGAANVQPNDNRVSAGTRRGDTLTIRLVVDRSRWFPQADGAVSVVADAIAEEGKAPQIPAPMIRVRAGTPIAVTVRNALTDSTVTFVGLQDRPASSMDSVRLAPGESKTVRFRATAAGTYAYRALVGKPSLEVERETTTGAFVVDAPGAPTNDRVFVINIWGDNPTPSNPMAYRNALTLNGRSWPHTERLSVALGDSVRFRVVNGSARVHPMHLHGFYFRVDARGSGLADTTYGAAQRRLAATEDMLPGSTMNMVWYADRPGNWLFHCHLAFHVIPESALLDAPPPEAKHALSHDADVHMVGLILGITVKPKPTWTEPARTDAQQLRMIVQEGKQRGRAHRAMGYVMQDSAAVPAADSVRIPGPLLVMTRGRPTDITVVNRLNEPTGVHWHGIELESYSDGVVGWSGYEKKIAPPIAPNDSFVARLTLPRAGTFMYHTHLGDLIQLTSGLYGAIVVLEPGQRFDPRTDHVFVFGWDGAADPPQPLVNGDSILPPKILEVGRKHRLRFVNIGAAPYIRMALRRDTSLVQWRAVAKDGAALPPAQATLRPARIMMNVGETYDFEFDAKEPGEYLLSIQHLTLGPLVLQRPQRIIVR
jgi:FtsP/CotA-like multicopper oxidase with cupredoxin domain